MKLLIYGNRKQKIYDISTPKKEAAAYAIIFKSLDGDWEVYEELKESSEPQGTQIRWKNLYEKSKKGDFKAMKELMDERSREGYEYEELRRVEVINPLEELKS